MSKAWKRIDLEGQGLQSANIQLAGLLKRRARAYWLLLPFPLGLHRAYLEDSRGAWIYRLASLGALALLFFGRPLPAALVAALLAAFALYDLRWIEDRVARINKALRMQVYLHQGQGAPRGFKGHYTDAGIEDYLKLKEQERAGHRAPAAEQPEPGSRVPSFAEQERLLKELAKSKPRRN